MNFRIGITDSNWFNYLSTINPEDVNFWRPRGGGFKALKPGEPFLFKLKSPHNKVAGLGFFVRHIILPISIAWDAFGNRNGCETLSELRNMIISHREDKSEPNPEIGCTVLTNPIFFKQSDWIEMPSNWSKSIQTGKNYVVESITGSKLWNQIEQLILQYLPNDVEAGKSLYELNEPQFPQYGSILSKIRIGQGAFRVSVTDAYQKQCSITGEKTLPVLEAAHIKPYSKSGPNHASNGLLLRSDIHKLFDTGYITLNKELRIEVSARIREEFENGKEYYQYHGKRLALLPKIKREIPGESFIEWHNENVFNG